MQGFEFLDLILLLIATIIILLLLFRWVDG